MECKIWKSAQDMGNSRKCMLLCETKQMSRFKMGVRDDNSTT